MKITWAALLGENIAEQYQRIGDHCRCQTTTTATFVAMGADTLVKSVAAARKEGLLPGDDDRFRTAATLIEVGRCIERWRDQGPTGIPSSWLAEVI